NPRNLRSNLRNLREIRELQIIKLPNGFVPTAFSTSTTASKLLPSQASQNPRNLRSNLRNLREIRELLETRMIRGDG
ncbi:MAG TPA: hypothetical protein PLO35_02925, partial [Candidatus Cloacimonadota bacterium]|nr:hypothetical protein [Candidatus Cloacimonadota bacterium]